MCAVKDWHGFYDGKVDKEKYAVSEEVKSVFSQGLATIGRTENISKLLLPLIDWEEDALTLSFCKTKSDQEGERTNERKHIFASNKNSHICVILCMAIYIFGMCRNTVQETHVLKKQMMI